jgi:hypothetical protein
MLQHPSPPPLMIDPCCYYKRCSPRHHRRGRRHERRSRRRRGSWHGPPSLYRGAGETPPPHELAGDAWQTSAWRASRGRRRRRKVRPPAPGVGHPQTCSVETERGGVGLGSEVMTRRCGRGVPVLGEAGGEEGEGVGDALILRRRHTAAAKRRRRRGRFDDFGRRV